MTDDTTPPIEVHATPLPDMLWAALRQIAPPIATFALGKGWIDNDLLILLTAIAGVLWPIVAGQLKTRERATQLATAASDPRVPDEVLTVKQP